MRGYQMKEYYVGLDLGTNSVGWAVTDEKYNVLKFRGHRMWGSRLFEEGKTAEDRRTHRAARRRLQRRKNRLNILKELFADEINKVDSTFFRRLDESKYYLEDKTVKAKNILFNDEKYTDKDFYKKYPTIYHLRKALMEHPADDIRELYIAVHSILKRRGNFLQEGQDIQAGDGLESVFVRFMDTLSVIDMFVPDKESQEQIKEVLLDKHRTISDKNKEVSTIWEKSIDKENGTESKKQKKELANKIKLLVKLILGQKTDLLKLFQVDQVSSEDLDSEIKTIEFSKINFEEKEEAYHKIWSQYMDLLRQAKTVYDAILLKRILTNPKGLSWSKIDAYEDHARHLRLLKSILKTDAFKVADNKEPAYKNMFVVSDKNICNYVRYIGGNRQVGACTKDGFYKYVEEVLTAKGKEETADIQKVLTAIKDGSFMPLLRTSDNGVIPYQLNYNELKRILEKAAEKYDFLNKVDDGVSVADKILQLMKFRIPYYVGPLNTYHARKGKSTSHGFAWAVRKAAGPVYPWNFDEKIDKAKSAEAFIKNMTSICTYIVGEDVLPRQSINYSRFALYNELNSVKYDGQPLPYAIKEKLINEIFLQDGHKRVSKKFIAQFLKANGQADGKGEVTGIDDFIKSDLKSERDMHRILGSAYNLNMAEHIILWVTLFGDAKEILTNKIQEHYKLTEEQINKIKKLHYRDWGRISQKFLSIKGFPKDEQKDEPERTVLEALHCTNHVIMELLSSHYTYMEAIESYNASIMRSDGEGRWTYDLVEDLYVSPAVKRTVWQTLKIIKEIKKIQGEAPKKVFVEVPRTNRSEKKKKDSRQKQLIELYKNVKTEYSGWVEQIKKTELGEFKSKKLYLYYLQQGKCMYSGNEIDINELFTKAYDIDHIYPRSLTKDNSFDNLVLVEAKYNRDKGDAYPIKQEIQKNMKGLWHTLRQQGFMSERKFERLVRDEPLSAEELADFINRQIVETSQSTKAIMTLLKQVLPESAIVYVKAENVSDFRHDQERTALADEAKDDKGETTERHYEFLKVRDLNNHHHAKDAYLNIVVGNVYHEKFINNPITYIKEQKNKRRPYSLNHLFDREIIVRGKSIWNPQRDIPVVRKMMQNNDVRVTRKLEEQKGSLYNLTLNKAKIVDKNVTAYFPQKGKGDPVHNSRKYGGYENIKNSYFSIVRYETEKEQIIRLIPIPIYISNKNDKKQLAEYINCYVQGVEKHKILMPATVIYPKVLINTLLQIDGYLCYSGGKSNERYYIDPAISLLLDGRAVNLYKKMEKVTADMDDSTCEKLGVSREDSQAFFELLLLKLQSPIFKKNKDLVKKLTAITEINQKNGQTIKDRIMQADIAKQVGFYQDFIAFIVGSKTRFPKAKEFIALSRATKPLNMSKCSQFNIITQSITGLYEQSISII